ncbi:MAG TPA: transglutaminase domain-containing protein [Candidatus Acidoferrales bacterium]|nr:transglutaminase domain-containing protein [Candidatus Acidoferrales bacterium]
MRAARTATAEPEGSVDKAEDMDTVRSARGAQERHPIFRTLCYGLNILLILAILAAVYSGVWEYSTRRYLRGFSDAVVPESASVEQKVEAILQWMSHGPARQDANPPSPGPYRDPTDTLNYASLLSVCGSATNAFINLSDSAGLKARRLLLVDSRRMTKHVVAEVLVDGRWIVVDPAFRTILRGTNGQLLTREELANPAVFANATRGIAGYDPAYTYDRTSHVHLSRLRFVGVSLRNALNWLAPGWDDSAALSMLLERESLATLVLAVMVVLCLSILRAAMRWYGEHKLGVRPIRFRQQIRRAFEAFVDTTV